jgi:non-specific serine/threonine protein kinase
MFFHMLTGALPFNDGNEASLAFKILHVDAPLPSSYRMDIPGSIDEIVMKSLAKNLEDRYRNWEEFERAVVSAFDNFPKEQSSFPDTDKFNVLHKMDFFSEFKEIELWEVLRISKWAYYPEGTSIIREGDETASFFIIISGEVEIRKNGIGVCTLKAGECFGEMSGIRKAVRRRTASVFAYSDIKLIEVSERLLHQSSETCQRHFDKAFLAILANRLAAAETRIRPNKTVGEVQPSDVAPPSKQSNIKKPVKNPSSKTLARSEPSSQSSAEERLEKTLGRIKLGMIALIIMVMFALLLNVVLLFK